MTRHKFSLLFLSFLWAVYLPQLAVAATPVIGTLTTNTTWDAAGSPYIITSAVTVNSGVTLTVTPGTVVKFGSAGSLIVIGTLSAVGTSGSMIHFTDLRDDAVDGNDTNSDGPSVGTPGGWQNINVSAGGSAPLDGSAVFDFCSIRFGGGMISGSVYKYGNGSLTVSNSTVSDSKTYGINYVAGISTAGNISVTSSVINANGSDGINLSGTNGTINLSGNTISNNTGSGIFIDSGSFTLQNNTVSNNGNYGLRLMGGTLTSASGNVASGNTAGPVRILANYLPSLSANTYTGKIEIDGGILLQSMSLVVGTPYVAVSNFEVAVTATLTAPAGTIVKFGSGAGINVSGTLNAVGVDGNLVHFTDLRDDTVGGDTNGDGTATAPAAGGWNGISVVSGNATLAFSGSATLAFSSIRYANTNISKFGVGNLTVSNCTIDTAAAAGISISASAGSHSITVSTITNNGSDGLRFTGNSGTITVSGNSITGNSGSGIYSDSAALALQNNSITGNSGYALNLSGGTLSAPITGNTFSGNTLGAFRLMAEHLQPLSAAASSEKIVIAGGTITSTTNLNATTPYVVEEKTIITIGATTGTLNMPAGTVMKFKSGSGIDVLGMLNASGVAANPVYFTDLRDDSAGGDTNGDGPSAGAPGGWRGILITSGSAILAYSTVRFGSDNIKSDGSGSITISNSIISNASASGIQLSESVAALSVSLCTVSNNGTHGIQLANNQGTSGTISISGSTISYNADRGISAEGAGTNPAISNNIIAKNAVGVYAASGALPVVGGLPANANSIFQNSAYGVQNAGATAITATNNWWGSSTGPRHTTNPTGTGNAVSNLVIFIPYRTTQTFTEAVATFTPELYDFKRVRVGVPSPAQPITVTNVSSQTLVFGAVAFSGPNPTEFQISSDTCTNASIAAGASCTVAVTFTPTAKQAFTAQLDFPAGGTSVLPLYSVALSGTGFTPATLPFYDDFIGSYSTDWSIVNPKAGTSILASYTIGTDNETGVLNFVTSDGNLFGATTTVGNIFTLALPTGLDKMMVTTKMNFKYPPTLDSAQGGIILLPEKNSQPDLSNFIRTQYGRWSGVARFQTTTNVNSAGTDYPGPQAPTANWYWLRLIKRGNTFQSLYSSDGITFTPWRTDTLLQETAYAGLFAYDTSARSSEEVVFGSFTVEALPTISAPTSVAFGNVPNGSMTLQNVTISNTGSGPLTVSSLNLSGTNAALFSVDPGSCSQPVPPGSTCSLSLTLNASVMGPVSATLAIGSNDIDTPTVSVAVSGSVTAPISLSVGFLGTGGGTVRHEQSGAVCNTGCNVISTTGATATFTATPAEFSLFAVWGGSCSGSGACSFTSPGTTGGVTATFDRDNAHSVKIEPASYYSSILGAYGSAGATGTTIKTWGDLYTETLLFSQPVHILLDGGYNGVFTAPNGLMTTVKGSLTIRPHATLGSGRVDVRSIAVKP